MRITEREGHNRRSEHLSEKHIGMCKNKVSWEDNLGRRERKWVNGSNWL